MSNPQLTYSMDPPIGKLGMLRRSQQATQEIGSLPAFVAIQPGDLLEKFTHTDGQRYVRPAQSANGALKSLAGVAVYKTARAPRYVDDASTVTGYAVGEQVPYCRKGQIFAKWQSTDGTTAQVGDTVPNYEHSTTTNPQGAFTDKTTASTAGSEVDACPTGIQLVKDVTASLGFGICLVELNLP